MAEFTFQDLRFYSDESRVRVVFKKHFHFFIKTEELDAIGTWKLEKPESISIEGNDKLVRKRFDQLISQKIQKELYSNRGNKAYYVFEGPLIGGQRFGILESDTSVIEVRPMTTCNLNCNYCSIDEGIHCKEADYYVDVDHMLKEFEKLIVLKTNPVTVRVCSHGEPLLYPELEALIAGLKKFPKVAFVTLGTNGTLLTKQKIAALKEAGLDQVGLSLNAFDQEVALKIAGCAYNVERIKEICKEIRKQGLDLIIAPVLLPGINDDQMEKLIVFAKEIGAKVGIQNFLPYKGGRNPVKGIPMEEFNARLKGWEQKYDIQLVRPNVGFSFSIDKCLAKPFSKGDTVTITGSVGEYGYSKERLIKIGTSKKKVKLIRDKHNIFIGV